VTVTATSLWRRLDASGHDAACLRQIVDGYHISGQAVFLDAGVPVALQYAVYYLPDWSTRSSHVAGFVGDRVVDTHIARTARGWTVDRRDVGLVDVLDLDLGFTPATNFAQLRRISLSHGQAITFDVAWLEAGDDDLKRLPQTYKRTSEHDYAYQSPTHDYRETLVVAPDGFVAEYPGLWTREP
jgi:uncharacterized protein